MALGIFIFMMGYLGLSWVMSILLAKEKEEIDDRRRNLIKPVNGEPNGGHELGPRHPVDR